MLTKNISSAEANEIVIKKSSKKGGSGTIKTVSIIITAISIRKSLKRVI